MKKKRAVKCDITKLPLYRLAEVETYKRDPDSLLIYSPYIEKKARMYINKMCRSGYYLDPDEAEKDMIQDLWVKVLMSRESYNVIDDTQFKTFISRVLDNYAKNWANKTYRKYEKCMETEEIDGRISSRSTNNHVHRDAEICIAKDDLKGREKYVFNLLAKGYTQSEIAGITGLSQPSISIAKAKLKEKMTAS